MSQAIKVGMQVSVIGSSFDGAETKESAIVARWPKVSGNRADLPGYHHVRFVSGGSLLVHESRMVAA